MPLQRSFNLENPCENRILNIIFFIISTVFLCTSLIQCNNKSEEINNKMNEATEKIEKSQHIAFTELKYASSERVIFNGGIGLIVYDIPNKEIYRAVNLQDIDMNHIQGDNVTIFQVKEDGSQILMHNFLDNNRYLYDIESDTIEKTDIKEFTNEYRGIEYLNEESNGILDGIESIANYANIDDKSICYLMLPKEDHGSKGIENLQILIKDKETDKEERYNVFR